MSETERELPGSTILQGPLITRRERDGRVVVEQAPRSTFITLEFVRDSDPAVVRFLSGDRIRLADQVEYRITGWDAHSHALTAERVNG